MKKVKELIQQVYRYEKQAEIETRYLSNVLYWSFFLLMFVTDLLFKKYRIRQEEEEKAMEAEVTATIEEAQKLMVNSVAAIGRMIDEKDNYTRQHSQRVADYARLIAENLKAFPQRKKSWIRFTGVRRTDADDSAPGEIERDRTQSRSPSGGAVRKTDCIQ